MGKSFTLKELYAMGYSVNKNGEFVKGAGSKIRGFMNTKQKCGWREINGRRHYFRSLWECNYARILEWRKTNAEILDWQYEPDTFWFEAIRTGTRCYKPDFKVFLNSGLIEYHEVKGFMDKKSAVKLKRMRIYHPSVVVRVIDSTWFKSNVNIQGVIKGWERG